MKPWSFYAITISNIYWTSNGRTELNKRCLLTSQLGRQIKIIKNVVIAGDIIQCKVLKIRRGWILGWLLHLTLKNNRCFPGPKWEETSSRQNGQQKWEKYLNTQCMFGFIGGKVQGRSVMRWGWKQRLRTDWRMGGSSHSPGNSIYY